MKTQATYLGDGVYVEIEDNMFKLWTERYDEVVDRPIVHFIYLDMDVTEAFVKYIMLATGKALGKEYKQ